MPAGAQAVSAALVSHKGELQALGFQRAANFVNDRSYRDGRKIANSRDRRAAAKKTRHGRTVFRHNWPANEFAMLARLADAGVTVPFPVARTADGVLMQYIGDRDAAAPRLVHAGLDRAGRRARRRATRREPRAHGRRGVVHADLSVFNLLWWNDELWVIDVPQAVDIGDELQAFDFLLRDLANVASWFRSKGSRVRCRSTVLRPG